MLWTDIARRQGGLIARSQLEADGVARTTVDNWLAVGRLEPTATRSVYRVGGAPTAPETDAWYAALSTRSPVSYLSSARWWGMPVPDDDRVHITRFDRKRLDWPPGVRVHRVLLDPAVVVQHRGLLVTNRVETALDCMGWLRPSDATAFTDRAVAQSWVSALDVARRLENQPGRWGNRQLRRLAAHMTDGAAAESERRLHRLLRDAGVTGWTPNLGVRIAGRRYVIDVAFAAARLAIEVDGFRYHSAAGAFQTDRTKQNALMAAGWRVLRFTWQDIVERPRQVLSQIAQLLAA